MENEIVKTNKYLNIYFMKRNENEPNQSKKIQVIKKNDINKCSSANDNFSKIK